MLIQELTLRNLLSFGPDSPSLKMGPLNVLIGPNGSGKSNLIEAIGLLRSTATKSAVASGGGMADWLWKGAPTRLPQIEVVVQSLEPSHLLSHQIEYAPLSSGRFAISTECIQLVQPDPSSGRDSLYCLKGGDHDLANRDGSRRVLLRQDVFESILLQLKEPFQYPEITYLGEVYGRVRLYREWSFGRSSVFRAPQAADMPGDELEEDFSNLGLFLNHLRSVPKAKNVIIEHLRDLYAGIDDFDVRVKGGTVEVFLTEGDFVIPARRLSDGTLRYLCLLAILCDPEPPPLICIEEPELGLHPDMLPKLADLLVEASSRTQLVVTTHSDILVDAMTERPECVVVFEKRDGQTHMHRLDRDELKQWLDQYRLGQLWTRGQIGGTRW
jgi:predicted ATPase